MKLPSGPGVMRADATRSARGATAACRAAVHVTAEIAVSGSVGGQRFRARLLAGPGARRRRRVSRRSAPFGQPLFIFVARHATRRPCCCRAIDRVLEHGRSDAVLEAVAGVPLDAAALCARADRLRAGRMPLRRARQLGDDWRRRAPTDRRSLPAPREGQRPGGWSRRSIAERSGWRADTAISRTGLPRHHPARRARGRARFDLRLTLSQVELNPPLGAEVFAIQIPRLPPRSRSTN